MWKDYEDADASANSEETTSSEDNSKTSSESNTDSGKKWKKFDIWKEYKKLKKENKFLRDTDTKAEAEAEEESKKPETQDDVKYDIFLIRNPEAEEYKWEMSKILAKYPNMSFEEAFTFTKANFPKSESSKNFSTKSKTPKKELVDYTEEEILALKDKSKLLEWSRANWMIRKK